MGVFGTDTKGAKTIESLKAISVFGSQRLKKINLEMSNATTSLGQWGGEFTLSGSVN